MGQLRSASAPVLIEAASLTFLDIFFFLPPRLELLKAPGITSVTAPCSPLFYALIAKDHLPKQQY